MVAMVLVALLPSAVAGAAAPCGQRIGEKLGIRFVEVCDPGSAAPFWISVAPMPCTAGDHETIACPSITPLLGGRGPDGPLALTARRVAMVDAVSAHRMCALRFAGRIASRTELERARAVLALAALVVSEPGPPGGGFRFDTRPEWSEDGACENPSKPGDGCRFARWPSAAARSAPFATVRACDARRIPAGPAAPTAVAIDGHCRVADWSWRAAAGAAGHELPCPVRVGTDDAVFSLACRAPAALPEAAPPDAADVAGFRCVVPTWALATFQSAAPP